MNDDRKKEIEAALGLKPNDLLLIIADQEKVACEVLSRLRLYLGGKLGLIPKDDMRFLWVTDFPLVEYDTDEKRYVAKHHPFTAPNDQDVSLLETDPGQARALAYDIVLNGVELGGGSIRIHHQDVQQKIFALLGNW